jgi:hypothetical protein
MAHTWKPKLYTELQVWKPKDKNQLQSQCMLHLMGMWSTVQCNCGVGRSVLFASCALTKVQQGDAQIKWEALEIATAVTKFHKYLMGKKFTLLTDNLPRKTGALYQWVTCGLCTFSWLSDILSLYVMKIVSNWN